MVASTNADLVSSYSEIFDLVSALEAAEGKGATFCQLHHQPPTAPHQPPTTNHPIADSLSSPRADTFLNVTKSVTEKELSKAYRKRSLELQ